MKKRLFLLPLLGLTMILLWSNRTTVNHLGIQAQAMRALNTIPPNDRAVLHDFFYWLCILENDPGYTLFGNKPLAWISVYKGSGSVHYPSINYIYLSKRALAGFEIWKKYQYLFPSKRFSIVRASQNRSLDEFIIMNKPAVMEVMQKNSDLFSLEFSPQQLSSDECLTILSKKLLQSEFPQELVGILLGFGRENSLAFSRACKIQDSLSQLTPRLPYKDKRGLEKISTSDIWWLSPLKKEDLLNNSPLTPNQPFQSIGEEFSFLRGARQEDLGYPLNFGIMKILLPGFIVTKGQSYKGSETDQLLAGYTDTRKKMIRMSRKKTFLLDCITEWMK